MINPPPPNPYDLRLLEALGHDDYFVRNIAMSLLSYMPESSLNTAATHAAIAAIERHGADGAFEFPHQISSLPIDTEALDWALEKIVSAGSQRASLGAVRSSHLIDWVASSAPTDLLQGRDLAPLELAGKREPHRHSSARRPRITRPSQISIVERRLELTEESAEECISLIEAGAVSCLEIEGFPHDVIRDLNLICERLAKTEVTEEQAEQIISWLDTDVDFDAEARPEEYRAGIAIKLAGRLRLEPTAPRLIAMLDADWDWWDESIVTALSSIGSETTFADITERYAAGRWHVRNYLSCVLDSVCFPSDGAIATLTQLANAEEDHLLLSNLGCALAAYGTEESMAEAHAIYDANPTHPERFRIVEIIYMFTVLAGDKEETLGGLRNILQEKRDRRCALAGFGTEQKPSKFLSGESPAPSKKPPGRNDPCQCGSGKKYKKCCL